MELTLLGAGLGLAAGISPGPLLALLAIASIERGFRAGARVAVAPLLTDAPIVALVLLLVKDLPASLLGVLTFLGGLFVVYLGVQNLRTGDQSEPTAEVSSVGARDLWQGAVVNFLNPHPWIFWIGVGAPTLVSGWRQSPLQAIGYLAGFYSLIVGSKLVLAWLAARGGQSLGGPWFGRVVRLCGALLLFLGALLCYRGAVQLWPAPESPSGAPSYLM